MYGMYGTVSHSMWLFTFHRGDLLVSDLIMKSVTLLKQITFTKQTRTKLVSNSRYIIGGHMLLCDYNNIGIVLSQRC